MKRVLIIDDEDQADEITNLERVARQRGIPIQCTQFKVGSAELPEVLTDNHIDLSKVEAYFKENIGRQHLVCFDYNLGTEEITGVDVLTKLKSSAPRSKFLFYSSLLDNIVRQMLEEYRGGQGKSFDKVKKNLIALISSRVEGFVDRRSFLEKILEILTQEKEETLDDIFEEKMQEYQGFRSEYFDGLEISSLFQLLNTNDGRAINFKKEIVEQFVAYIIKLQDDDE
ncbi:MAG: hypothetical protein HY842_02595 [Bacteroidetes bacterium]|nr:hypothetical protein [Bacteroidota bacterium]